MMDPNVDTPMIKMMTNARMPPTIKVDSLGRPMCGKQSFDSCWEVAVLKFNSPIFLPLNQYRTFYTAYLYVIAK